MVDTIIRAFDQDIDDRLAGDDTDGPGRFTRAYIRATMEPSSARPDREDRLGAALIAAAAAQPELLAPLQVAADRWQARLEDDGIDPTVATLVRLACDGLWLSDLFGLAPLPADTGATTTAYGFRSPLSATEEVRVSWRRIVSSRPFGSAAQATPKTRPSARPGRKRLANRFIAQVLISQVLIATR